MQPNYYVENDWKNIYFKVTYGRWCLCVQRHRHVHQTSSSALTTSCVSQSAGSVTGRKTVSTALMSPTVSASLI